MNNALEAVDVRQISGAAGHCFPAFCPVLHLAVQSIQVPHYDPRNDVGFLLGLASWKLTPGRNPHRNTGPAFLIV